MTPDDEGRIRGLEESLGKLERETSSMDFHGDDHYDGTTIEILLSWQVGTREALARERRRQPVRKRFRVS